MKKLLSSMLVCCLLVASLCLPTLAAADTQQGVTLGMTLQEVLAATGHTEDVKTFATDSEALIYTRQSGNANAVVTAPYGGKVDMLYIGNQMLYGYAFNGLYFFMDGKLAAVAYAMDSVNRFTADDLVQLNTKLMGQYGAGTDAPQLTNAIVSFATAMMGADSITLLNEWVSPQGEIILAQFYGQYEYLFFLQPDVDWEEALK